MTLNFNIKPLCLPEGTQPRKPFSQPLYRIPGPNGGTMSVTFDELSNYIDARDQGKLKEFYARFDPSQFPTGATIDQFHPPTPPPLTLPGDTPGKPINLPPVPIQLNPNQPGPSANFQPNQGLFPNGQAPNLLAGNMPQMRMALGSFSKPPSVSTATPKRIAMRLPIKKR